MSLNFSGVICPAPELAQAARNIGQINATDSSLTIFMLNPFEIFFTITTKQIEVKPKHCRPPITAK
jgi:hypothetical protein